MRIIVQLGSCLVAWAVLVLAATPTLSADTGKTSLTGQIVCSQCWFEADREATAYGSTEDLACAVRCSKEGIGSTLAVRDDDGYQLYALRGAPPGGGDWAEWAGRFVEAEGIVDTRKGKDRFRAKALTVLDASPWPHRRFADNHHDDTPEGADEAHDHAGLGDHEGSDDHADHPAGGDPSDREPQPEQAAEANVESGIVWTDLRGAPAPLDDLHEQIVLVNFWATWCLPCKKEMPDLIELHDQFSPYRIEFVGASVDAPDQAEAVLQFVRQHKINFPIVLGATTADMEQLGLPPTLPGTVLLDEHGHVMDWFPGVIDPQEVQASLSNLLGLADGGLTGTPSRVARGRPDTRGHQSHASLVPS